MSKILVVPDIHGRSFWKEPCQQWQGPIIFLGDYHDPYPFQVSRDNSLANLKELADFVEANQSRCVCLIGNHDANPYLGIKCPQGGRTDHRNLNRIGELIRKLNPQFCYYLDNIIFSHSGALLDWVNYWELNPTKLDELSKDSPALEDVSPNRWGYSQSGVGSILFGDVVEYADHKHIPGYYQVFGHTQLEKDPIIQEDYACLDCRQCFIMDTETKEIVPYNE